MAVRQELYEDPIPFPLLGATVHIRMETDEKKRNWKAFVR